jgi:predicted RNase H-like HicB family nuclease
VAKFLREKGLSLQKIRTSLHYLRKHLPEIERPLAQLRFLTDGETIFVLTNDDRKIIDTLKKGQYVLAIAIEPLIKDLVGKTSQATTERAYMVTVSKRRFKVILHPDLESGGYWVECPELPGCSSQGDSLEEALDMIKDAIKGHVAIKGEERKAAGLKRRVA